jgi:hypothetical protein
MALRVVVDLFSGRPNPGWTLDVANEAEFRRRLELARTAPSRDSRLLPGLGYRGLVVRASEEENAPELCRIHGESIVVSGSSRLDAGRQFERWLLSTGKGVLEPSLFEMVKLDVG